MTVHRAVALAFLGPCPAGAQVNHRSGDKQDNSVGNLEYVSCGENIRHAWSHGLCTPEHCRGEKNNHAKLTSEDVRAIRAMRRGSSLSQIAAAFGVTKENVSQIVNRKTWKHVA